MPSTLADKNLQLCEIAPGEISEIAHFIARKQLNSQSSLSDEQVAARLRWIVMDNPAREPGMPLGWCLRDELGTVAGCICCAPQNFVLQGKVVTLMMSSSFYVDQQHRAAGVSIFLKFLQLGKRYPLFASSANAVVAEMWKRMGAFPIGNSEHEMLGVRRWRGVVEEGLVQRLGNNSFTRTMTMAGAAVLSITKRLGKMDEAGALLPIERPEEGAVLCAKESERFTSLRDTSYLRWRYFSQVDPTTRLYAFHAARDSRDYMIATNFRQRGYRSQIRTVNVLDVFPEPNPEIYRIIAQTMIGQYQSQADVLVFRCLGRSGQHAMRMLGFVRREFAAPIAWCFDKFQNLPSRDWYFVPADGDMLL